MTKQGDKGITWTDATWNPTRGCSKVSTGCMNCYAMHTAHRFSGEGFPYHGLTTKVAGKVAWTGRVDFVPEMLGAPLKWRRPGRVFVDSMSDLFHESVSDTAIAAVFGVMMACKEQTFQILTKRPDRMKAWFAWVAGHEYDPQHICQDAAIAALPAKDMVCHLQAEESSWPLPNVHLGVSVEDQAAADRRIPVLLKVPAAMRFLSCEPLLGAVDLTRSLVGAMARRVFRDAGGTDEDGIPAHLQPPPSIDWVIVGGESGPDSRPMHPDWARSLRDQCAAAGVPFHFKQWGEWVGSAAGHDAYGPNQLRASVYPSGGYCHLEADSLPAVFEEQGAIILAKVGKKRAGRVLDGVTHDAFPDVRP